MDRMPLGLLGVGTLESVVLLIAVAGIVILLMQRERQNYELSRLAIEKGLTNFPGMGPAWLKSLRKGVIALALGLGLLGVGVVGWITTPRVAEPTWSAAETRPATLPDAGPEAPRDARDLPPGRGAWPPPPERGMEPAGPGGPPHEHRGPPRMMDPRMEPWRRAEDRRIVCATATAAGAVLTLLGVALTAFALYERRILERYSEPK